MIEIGGSKPGSPVLERLKTLYKEADLQILANLIASVPALLLLLPFAGNHFLQGRFLLGLLAVSVVLVLAINAYLILTQRFSQSLVFFGLMPLIAFFILFSLRLQGPIGALWTYPAVMVCYILLPRRQAYVANLLLLTVALSQSTLVFQNALALRFVVTLLAVSAFAALFTHVIGLQQARLENLASTDPLTGVRNRSLLELALDQTIFRCQRNKSSAALLVMDLDYFKKVNDRHGHDVGDRVLREVGALLRRRLRRVDNAYRLGGDEFLILLEDSDEKGAMKVAEELRTSLLKLVSDAIPAISTSIGVTAWREGENWQSWVKRGDQNLYRAKAAGRNQVLGDPETATADYS